MSEYVKSIDCKSVIDIGSDKLSFFNDSFSKAAVFVHRNDIFTDKNHQVLEVIHLFSSFVWQQCDYHHPFSLSEKAKEKNFGVSFFLQKLKICRKRCSKKFWKFPKSIGNFEARFWTIRPFLIEPLSMKLEFVSELLCLPRLNRQSLLG